MIGPRLLAECRRNPSLLRCLEIGPMILSLLVQDRTLTEEQRKELEATVDGDERRRRLLEFVTGKSVLIWTRWLECLEHAKHDHVAEKVRCATGEDLKRVCIVIRELFSDIRSNIYVGIAELLTLMESRGLLTREDKSAVNRFELDNQDARSSMLLVTLLNNSLGVWRTFLRQLEETSNNEKSAFTAFIRAEIENSERQLRALCHDYCTPYRHVDKFRQATARNAKADSDWERAKKTIGVGIDRKHDEIRQRRISMQQDRQAKYEEESEAKEQRRWQIQVDRQRRHNEIQLKVREQNLKRSYLSHSAWSIASMDLVTKQFRAVFKSLSTLSLRSTTSHDSATQLQQLRPEMRSED